MKSAKLAPSPRLRRALDVLERADGWLTTRDLIAEANICAVNSVVAELRDNGCRVSPADLAALRLPGLPSTARRINALADRAGWRSDPARYRRIAGRGGGWEYHRDVLPAEARAALAALEVRGGGQRHRTRIRPRS